jgi:DNA-binding NarL/FixJ family response regulator
MAEQVPARVLLVDDHELAREAMLAVLALEEDLQVVGEAQDGHEALRLARELQPDLIVLDLRMPGMDGLVATQQLMGERPSTKIVVLTSYDTPAHLLEALRLGACGFVTKGASKRHVLDVIRGALAGEVCVDPALGSALASQMARTGSAGRAGLTRRELDILQLVAEGRTNHAIAHELGLTGNTIKTHLRHILRKLRAPDRAAAVARAASLGLLRNASPVGNHPIG